MPAILRPFLAVLAVLSLVSMLAACMDLDSPDAKANKALPADLVQKIAAIGSTPGAPMMMRIFKQDSVLEVWKQTASGKYALLTTYKICAWSGGLGPKISEGDRQSPEGFYNITPGLMNAKSSYYLAFNTGFPNKFDKAWGRTGGDLMVHGDCSSSGCYAMNDDAISQIFGLMRETFKGGSRSVQLEIFPFRMTDANLAELSGSPNMAFWRNIKTGYDSFEKTGRPPSWDVCDKKYVFNSVAADGQPLDGAASCPALKPDPAMTAALAAPAVSASFADTQRG
jgi:murein L,D-transpeptidase YafK